MFITLDEYYDIEFYNECKETLKNNDVKFKEFISVKPPYNWHFEVQNKPMFVNYDEMSTKDQRWLVNKVQVLRDNEEYLFLRRNNDKGPKALLKFVENEPLKESRKSDYSVFFSVKNREELERISKEYPAKIWYFGKYYRNKYRVCLANNSVIKNFLNPDQILLEKSDNKPGMFEAELNWKVFRGFDMLEKFTETPYFLDGKYHRVKIKPEISSRYII